jgi:hypothetical protein
MLIDFIRKTAGGQTLSAQEMSEMTFRGLGIWDLGIG